MDLKALYQLSYGVYLCSSWDEGRPVGCVANSAMQITSKPATIAISLNHDNYTNLCVKKTGYFAVAVLAQDSNPLLIGKFGFFSSKEKDKFSEFPYAVRGKLPVVDDCLCWVSCKVVDSMETSTHTVFLGEIIDAGVLKQGEPMTYAYYHKELKGKTSPKAPTFQAETTEKAKYVCKLCGYVYDGETPFEQLPDDWRCPVCGAPKSQFEKR